MGVGVVAQVQTGVQPDVQHARQDRGALGLAHLARVDEGCAVRIQRLQHGDEILGDRHQARRIAQGRRIRLERQVVEGHGHASVLRGGGSDKNEGGNQAADQGAHHAARLSKSRARGNIARSPDFPSAYGSTVENPPRKVHERQSWR